MVFEPTFEEIGHEATILPEVADDNDAEPLEGDLPKEELPPLGE